MIGKRLLAQDESIRALLHMLYSIRLFTRLSIQTKAPSGGGITHQLSVRWFHLASVFQSNGMIDEACVALVASLAHVAHEKTSSCDETTNESSVLQLLQYLTSVRNGQFKSQEKWSSQIINRLLSLFGQRSQPIMISCPAFHETEALSLSSVLDILFTATQERRNNRGGSNGCQGMFGSKRGVPLDMEGLLRVMFLKSHEDEESKMRVESILVNQAKIIAEVIMGLGLQYQRLSCRDVEVSSWQMNKDRLLRQFQNFLPLFAHHIRNLSLPCDEASASVLVAFYVAAAHSIYSSAGFDVMPRNSVVTCIEQTVDCPPLVLARHILTNAEEVIKTAVTDGGSEWGAMLASLRVVVSSYQLQISRLEHPILDDTNACHFQLCLESTQCLETINLQSPIFDASRTCLWRELVQFHDRLSLVGLLIPAAYIAECTRRLSKLTTDDSEGEWSHALALHSLMKAEIFISDMDMQKSTKKHAYSDISADAGETIWCYLAKVERESAELQLSVTYSNDKHELLVLAKKAMDIFDSLAIDGLVPLAKWVSGSVAEAISEIYEAFGSLRESLLWRRRCLQSCTQSLGLLKQQPDSLDVNQHSLPFWAQSITATHFGHLSERHFKCLRRIALLYGKLGNYRKSEGYALIALQNEDKNVPSTKSESHCIRSFASSSFTDFDNYNEVVSRRLFVQVKSQAMALDAVGEAFADLEYKSSDIQPSSCFDAFAQNRILNRIASLLVGKCHVISYLLFSDMLFSYNSPFGTVGDSVHGGRDLYDETNFVSYYDEARRLYDFNLFKQNANLKLGLLSRMAPLPLSGHIVQSAFLRLLLREARSMIHVSAHRSQAVVLCSEITASPYSSRSCRAWAFYYLGLVELDIAQNSGLLLQLWSGQCFCRKLFHEMLWDE